MAKKVIQVPVGDELLESLNELSKKHGRPRADLIRTACELYLKQVQEEQLDEQYERGYREHPETLDVGVAQVEMAKEVLPAEKW